MLKDRRSVIAIDDSMNDVMNIEQSLEVMLEEGDVPDIIAINVETLARLCACYGFMYNKLIESKTIPTPRDGKRFPLVYH